MHVYSLAGNFGEHLVLTEYKLGNLNAQCHRHICVKIKFGNLRKIHQITKLKNLAKVSHYTVIIMDQIHSNLGTVYQCLRASAQDNILYIQGEGYVGDSFFSSRISKLLIGTTAT